MKTKNNKPVQLKISQKDIREFSEKRIEYILGFFNRITNSCVYMIDYRTQKIIFSNTLKPPISGFSRESIKQSGFNIYSTILPKSELKWLTEMQEKSRRIYYRYRKLEERIGIEYVFDFTAKTKNGEKRVLYQRIIPYRLCDDGHLWLALSIISSTPLTQKESKACIKNNVTGDRYDYINNEFVLSEKKILTHDEVTILGYLANGYRIAAISKMMGLQKRTVERKVKSLSEKLNARTREEAVYRGVAMGVI